MTDINITRVLADMRALAAEAGHTPQQASAPAGKADFAQMLSESIDKVNQTQKSASATTKQFEAGDPNVDLTEVMLALQKADISFKAMTEVRNKLVDAYREIMNMPI